MKWFVYFISVATTLQGFALRAQDSKRILFPKETPVLFNPLSDSSLQRFTPSLTDIGSADQYLLTRLFLNTAEDRNPPALNLYYRQYVGFLRGGKKYIFINAACRKPDYFTKKDLVSQG